MKITLRSNFQLNKDIVELESPGATIKDLLEEVSSDLHFLSPSKILNSNWVVVSLNQKEIRLLPQGLGTALKDKDEVEIAIASFSGGGLPSL